jgi:hypothetical protein
MIECRSDGLIINHDGTVWPCCWTATNQELSSAITNAELNWNNLSVHEIDEILGHHLFTTHFNDEHWNDETNCDIICKNWCTVKK